jgi:hypothetical protein
MTWRKLGLVFEPPSDLPWLKSHAALPAVAPDGCRVYWSGRDGDGRAHVGWLELDAQDPARVVRVGPRAVLEPGPPGSFDESGVTVSCAVAAGSRLHLYYTGWSLGVTVPFYLFAGLAVSDDGGETFIRASPAPILDRSPEDPYLTASPWVIVENGLWRMWYVSGSRWERLGTGVRHFYNIRYAESPDGVVWERDPAPCIDFAEAAEYAFSRPCVVRDEDCYRMWYAFRGDRYRLGYAESADGRTWERKDAEAGLEASEGGWDSEMIAYPCVLDRGDSRFLLYNGNGYGRTGIGLARWETRARA